MGIIFSPGIGIVIVALVVALGVGIAFFVAAGKKND
jgi:hypothetical protein